MQALTRHQEDWPPGSILQATARGMSRPLTIPSEVKNLIVTCSENRDLPERVPYG